MARKREDTEHLEDLISGLYKQIEILNRQVSGLYEVVNSLHIDVENASQTSPPSTAEDNQERRMPKALCRVIRIAIGDNGVLEGSVGDIYQTIKQIQIPQHYNEIGWPSNLKTFRCLLARSIGTLKCNGLTVVYDGINVKITEDVPLTQKETLNDAKRN